MFLKTTRIASLMVATTVLAWWMSLSPSQAEPVEQTRYGKACLRLESRPKPWQIKELSEIGLREQALAKAGVQARWIQVVDSSGSPLTQNPFLPCPHKDAPRYRELLKRWVEEIHEAGMAAMTWYPLIFCDAGSKEHPDWRQVSLPGTPRSRAVEHLCCCFQSGYGDAQVKYCQFLIEEFNLDGIWFDGSVWSPIWERPLPVTCACEACKAKFKKDTGLDLPGKVDWSDPTFRRWVAWRYQEFGNYIGRLAGAIRSAHPDVAVVINHYHRPSVPWNSAIPLDRYSADIISGSEATAPDHVDLTMRLCRAYGRSQAEVWRPFDLSRDAATSAEPLLAHALLCYAAGGYPSYGGDWFKPRLAPTAALMTSVMQPIHDLAGGCSVGSVALHVSQQTETFLFAPSDEKGRTPFFQSLSTWTKGLGQVHLAPEYFYDADLTRERLESERIVFMPLSVALGASQARTVVDYVRDGGTLFLGAGAGQADREAQPRKTNVFGEALGFAFAGLPNPAEAQTGRFRLVPSDGGSPIDVSGIHVPLQLDGDWEVLYREGDAADAPPSIATRAFGKGRVLIANVDPLRTLGSEPVAEGHTRLDVVDETAAGGKYALKFIDDAIAPASHHPDLETRLQAFSSDSFRGGVLECDMRLGAGGQAVIEIRSTHSPVQGPTIHLFPNGRLVAGGKPVCTVPRDAWFHLKIDYTFAAEEKPSTYEITVRTPDGQAHRARAPSTSPNYRRTDWVVIYGPGTAPGTFMLDNLKIARTKQDGSQEEVHHLDFEGGGETFVEPTHLVKVLGRLMTRYAAPPIVVEAPEHVRMGAYEKEPGTVLVHLHNQKGLRKDWLGQEGPRAVLRCDFPVASARLPLTEKALRVRHQNGRHEIEVPSVGLYQVVELTRAK